MSVVVVFLLGPAVLAGLVATGYVYNILYAQVPLPLIIALPIVVLVGGVLLGTLSWPKPSLAPASQVPLRDRCRTMWRSFGYVLTFVGILGWVVSLYTAVIDAATTAELREPSFSDLFIYISAATVALWAVTLGIVMGISACQSYRAARAKAREKAASKPNPLQQELQQNGIELPRAQDIAEFKLTIDTSMAEFVSEEEASHGVEKEVKRDPSCH
jgi:hypothetical protein